MMRSPSLHAFLAACAALLISSAASADWPTNGRGICTDPAAQVLPMIASDGAGGAIIAWGDGRGTPDIYAQRVLYNGFTATGWPVNGTAIGTVNTAFFQGDGVPDGAGGAYFVWGGGDVSVTPAIYAQRVTASGALAAGWPTGGLFVGYTGTTGNLPHIAVDGTTGLFVCWNDASNLRIQHVLANGTLDPTWPAGGALITSASGSYVAPLVTSDGGGGAIVSWTDLGSNAGDIWAQHIGSDGLPVSPWPATGISVCALSGLQNVTDVMADGSGGAWLVWGDERNIGTSGRDLYVQRLTGSGALVSGWPADGVAVCDVAGTQGQGHFAADGAGGAFVVWLDRRTAPDGDLYIQHIDANGSPVSPWPTGGQALSVASGSELLTPDVIVSDGVGGAIVAWSDARDTVTTARDVYAERIDADGSVHSGWTANGVPLCTATGDQIDVQCVPDGNGGAIVTWYDARSGIGNFDIYAIGVRNDGTTPVLVSLVSAAALDDRVSLDWFAPEALPGGANIERRTSGSSWTAIAPAQRDGIGHVRFEDRAVARGTSYSYRLGAAGGAISGEIWVDVPGSPLSLDEAVADATGKLHVRFSLRSGAAANLQLFDVTGRCVRAQSQAGLGGGAHATELAGPLPQGLYWLRLTQDGAAVHRRVMVSR